MRRGKVKSILAVMLLASTVLAQALPQVEGEEKTIKVRLRLDGKTAPGYPVAAPADETSAVLFPHHVKLYAKAEQIRKDVFLQEVIVGQPFVLGWISEEMFGYISEPFVATTAVEIGFSPGPPATFSYDLTTVPKHMWPDEVHLLRITSKGGEESRLNCGLHSSPNKRGKVILQGLSGGKYRIEACSDSIPQMHPDPYLYDFRNVDIRAGAVNSFSATGPVLDTKVDKGDITISGVYLDQGGNPLVGKHIYLVPLLQRPDGMITLHCNYFYPKQRTDHEGRFHFMGVSTQFWGFQLECPEALARTCHSMKAVHLKTKRDFVLTQGKTTKEEPCKDSCGTLE